MYQGSCRKSVCFPHYFTFLGVFRANIVLAVASSSLQTIKPPHNKDPSRVRYIELSGGISNQKLSKDNQNTNTRQELDRFPKSWGESCWASTNRHNTNQRLGANGAEGM